MPKPSINWRSLSYLCVGFVIGAISSTLWREPDPSETAVQQQRELAELQTAVDGSDATPREIAEVVDEAEQIYATIVEEVEDYTAVLTKQERVDGVLGEKQRIQLKVQHLASPNPEENLRKRVYLRFLAPDSVAGREVIWGSDLNEGELVAHEAGVLGLVRVSLPPDSLLAMRGQKHPVYRIGFATLARSMVERGRELAAAGEVEVSESERKVGDVLCRNIIIESVGSALAMPVARIEVAIDPERQIPLRYASFGPPTETDPMPIEEVYEYTDVELNVGLTAEDFDPDNPSYEFP